MKKIAVYAIAMALLIFSVAFIPTGFVNAQWTEDDKTSEAFGPRADQLITRIYPAGVDQLMLALQDGKVDYADWETPAAYVETWTESPYNNPADPDNYLKMVDFVDIGQREFDINHKERIGGGMMPVDDPDWPGPDPSTYPDWTSPTSYKAFRQAIAHLANRTKYVTEILGGYAIELWTPIMPGIPGNPNAWFNTACEGAFPTSLSDARTKLSNAGFIPGTTGPIVPGGDNVRVYPSGHEKAGEDLDPLIFYIRSDDPQREQAGLHMATQMEMVGIPVDRKLGDIMVAYYPVFFYQDYHLYTGGWGLGIDPDYLYSLYGGEYINWPNYLWYNSTAFDYEAGENLFLGKTYAQCLAGCHAAQMIGWGPGGEVCSIPLWTSFAFSTRRGYYNPAETLPEEEEGGEYYDMIPSAWEGWVNVEGGGLGSYATVHPEGYDSGGILRIGQNQAPIKLNILKSEWTYEYNILLLGYDFLMDIDAYTWEDRPYLAEDWEMSWHMYEPEPGVLENCSMLVFELQDNIYWHDGEKFTSEDVKFAIEYYRDNLGWWYSNVQNVLEVATPDPYTVLVKLDVSSYWALHWIGMGVPMFPKHIWEGIVDPTVDMPDPDLIGTGMWKFNEYDEDAGTVVHDAFTAASPVSPFPNAPIRTNGPPTTFTGTAPPPGQVPGQTAWRVITRKTSIAKVDYGGNNLIDLYMPNLAIDLEVKNFMAGSTVTYTGITWNGLWTVTTTTTTENSAAVVLGPCDPPTTLTFTPVAIGTWTYLSTHTVSATHNNPIGTFATGTASVDIAITCEGDLNGDFTMNLVDAAMMSGSLGVLTSGIFTSNADVKGDGYIGASDGESVRTAFTMFGQGKWPYAEP